MGSIHANAIRVLAIWLSEVTELHIRTLELMNFVGKFLRRLESLDDKRISTA